MQHEEIPLTEKESLKLISKTIYEAKGYYYKSGLSALVYGFSVLICSLLAYMIEANIIVLPFSPFYLLVPVFFVQAWLQVKENKKKLAKTFTDEAIDHVWLGFFISALAAMCGGFAGLNFVSISIIILLMGLTAFIAGRLSKSSWLTASSFICWLLAVASFFMLNKNVYLLLSLSSVVIWIIPGFIMRTQLNKQLQSN